MTTIKQNTLRWALCLAVLLALMAGAATGAKASPGGAASTASAPGADLAFSPFRYAGASWYGPGLWGNKTACGATLRRGTLGVANKTLPCGTAVKLVYHGRALVTRVIDRGPYVKGRAFDLTQAASEALGFEGVGRLRYAVALSYARTR
jgi:peptidoglycan lytic transglycosylase